MEPKQTCVLQGDVSHAFQCLVMWAECIENEHSFCSCMRCFDYVLPMPFAILSRTIYKMLDIKISAYSLGLFVY